MKPIILVGNDINGINNNLSWSDLLNDIIRDLGVRVDFSDAKPFPLLYEEIYINAIRTSDVRENEIKEKIATHVQRILPNEIHERIIDGTFSDILTTNYEYALETALDKKKNGKNLGLVRERRYNIFRHHQKEDMKFWHIHGDIASPESIVLGYEHYSGQLQQMRNYVVTGTNYTSQKAKLKPLINRIGKDDYIPFSWIDYFFSRDLHIVGLSMDFIESDLWWLITLRARRKFEKSRMGDRYPSFLDSIYRSRITYYYPEQYYNKEKIQLMDINDIQTIPLPMNDKASYYHSILDRI